MIHFEARSLNDRKDNFNVIYYNLYVIKFHINEHPP